MTNEVNEQRVLILFLANDNHLSNVKTIQSVYKQDYPNIYLVACNDCTNHFQSERLFYNFEAGRPENVRGVYIQENPHPLGEYLSQKQFWDRTKASYVVTLHSGEYFVGTDALRKCVELMEEDDTIDALLAAAEHWSDDMKTCKKRYLPAGQGKDRQITMLEQASIARDALRDCMVLYRLDAIRNQEFQIPADCGMIAPEILTVLLEQRKNVTVSSQALCRFSSASIKDAKSPVTDTYGNEKLQKLSELIRERQSDKDKEAETSVQLFGAEASLPAAAKPENRWLTLYKYSRFSKLKSYAAIDLLAWIGAALLIMAKQAVLSAVGGVLLVLAALLLGWTAVMLGFNLYFKKNPQRLVGEQ